MMTIARIGHLNAEDAHWVMGMNRLRHAYLELHPELGQYFVTGQYDDMYGVFTTLGLTETLPGQHGLADCSHGIQTLPGMLTIIVAVVAGAWGALVTVALGAPEPVAIGVSAACFLLTITFNGITGRRAIVASARGLKPRFPAPKTGDA